MKLFLFVSALVIGLYLYISDAHACDTKLVCIGSTCEVVTVCD